MKIDIEKDFSILKPFGPSVLQVKIPEGYIEVKVAEDNTKEDIKDKKTEQERQ